MLQQLETYKYFNDKINDIVENSGTDYIDAVIHFCETHDLDLEFVGELIAKMPVLKSKIEIEAENLNFLPKTSRLPV